MQVTKYQELLTALLSDDNEIELLNSIVIPNSIMLREGKKLFSNKDNVFLSFINGDGIALEGNNEIKNISIQTAANHRAIFLDSTIENLKDITLEKLTVTGMIQILTRLENKRLNLNLSDIDIVSSDSRHYSERPMKYGVVVYQGALTVYNFNPDDESMINVHAENISIGRKNAPVLGSGIFISGFGDEGGQVNVEKLTTNGIYSNGMIPSGQPNLITGGIFIVYGAKANEITSNGPVETYGNNDMVLDVWGHVNSWIIHESVTSYGSSAIGFVNFGIVNEFRAEKPIQTYGLGSRGFNQYDGRIDKAYFKGIKTMGDGAIGIQISKPVGEIIVATDVKTQGNEGETLVKGQLQVLNAEAISVIEGGSIDYLEVGGNLITEGEKATAYHVNGGHVKTVNLKGDIIVNQGVSKEVIIEQGGTSDLNTIEHYLN